MLQMRQGDVFFERVDSIPDGLSVQKRDNRGRIVVAEGEATGHAHAISDPDVICFVDARGDMYLEVGEQSVEVQHEEHGTLTLNQGIYKAFGQREYSPEEIRRVID